MLRHLLILSLLHLSFSTAQSQQPSGSCKPAMFLSPILLQPSGVADCPCASTQPSPMSHLSLAVPLEQQQLCSAGLCLAVSFPSTALSPSLPCPSLAHLLPALFSLPFCPLIHSYCEQMLSEHPLLPALAGRFLTSLHATWLWVSLSPGEPVPAQPPEPVPAPPALAGSLALQIHSVNPASSLWAANVAPKVGHCKWREVVSGRAETEQA